LGEGWSKKGMTWLGELWSKKEGLGEGWSKEKGLRRGEVKRRVSYLGFIQIQQKRAKKIIEQIFTKKKSIFLVFWNIFK